MEDGAGWQFWSPYYEERFPDVLIQEAKLGWEKEGYPGITVRYSPENMPRFSLSPGMLFDTLTEQMRLGMRESDWERIAVPGLACPKRRGEYALRGVLVPWSLTDDGVTYKETAPGQRLAMQVEFVFSGEHFYFVDTDDSEFADLIDVIFMREHTPWLFSWKGKTVAFSEEGKRLMPEATLLPGAIGSGTPERWELFAAYLTTIFAVDRESIWIGESAIEWFERYYGLWAAIGGKMGEIQRGAMDKGLMVFGNESTRIELELPIGAQKAVMRIIRNDGAARL
jgi:hypothetical protein